MIGVSRAVIYMSLVGPTSIYRELETCPAKLVLDTATSLMESPDAVLKL